MSVGVLNKEQIKSILLDTHKIAPASAIEQGADDYSSIDLPLGNKYFIMPASCRPRPGLKVSQLIELYGGTEHELTEGTIFERDTVYLVPIACTVELPKHIHARATAKSSIGRLDALVRLVVDGQAEFDRIGEGAGLVNLYVEVVPITFNLAVRPGKCLSQIRFIYGPEDLCTLTKRELLYEHDNYLVNSDATPSEYKSHQDDPRGILLSLETTSDSVLGYTGFEALSKPDDEIDPWKRGDDRYDPTKFWKPVIAESDRITINTNSFYIFKSRERFKIPAHLAVECQAYSESLGDIRIHYAGFAHPFFGHDRQNGTPLIFEVRGHNMPTILRGGDALAKVYFWRMSEKAIEDKTVTPEYNNQELKLSGCFNDSHELWKTLGT
jgi:dCTP deaminase